MGGTEVHSAELAKRLLDTISVEVLTHCQTTAREGRTLNFDALKSSDDRHLLESIKVNRIGLSSVDFPGVRWIANNHHSFRFARAIFSVLYGSVVRKKVGDSLEDADLVHCIYNGLTDAADYAYKCAQRRNIPFVFTPNVLDTSDGISAWNSRRIKRLYSKSDALIALTQHEAEYLIRHGAEPDRVTVIPYGPVLYGSGDEARCREHLELGDRPIILFLGRMVKLKGYELLLEAFEMIKSSHPNAALVFMGPASVEVKAQLQRELHRDIHHIDPPEQQLKTDFLAAAEVVCVPSSTESLGVVYLEAFANRKPVVALDLPVLREVISHQEDGFLVNPDAQSIGNAIAGLLDDPAMAARMGQAGFDKVEKFYSWDNVVNGVLQVYTDAIEARSGEELLSTRIHAQ